MTRCCRMDDHAAHEWAAPSHGVAWPRTSLRCKGHVIHEGGARCPDCGHVVCACDAELARERREEWDQA